MSFNTSSKNVFAASSSSSHEKPVSPMKKVDPHYEDPTLRAPDEIVGTPEWGYAQYLENVRRTGVVRDFSPSTMDAYKFKSDSYTPEQLKAESELVNNILNFTAASDWAQIEDTDEDGVSKENDKKWMSPKYPDQLFETGRILEHATGETHYFPIANMEDDPLGIAMHYEVSPDGTTYTIRHNGFVPYGNARDRRFWRYQKKHKERLDELTKHNKELEAERINSERLMKLGPERAAELEKSDKRNKELEMKKGDAGGFKSYAETVTGN
jgi:hypothetical protein